MEREAYDIVKTYRVVRLAFTGFSISIPYRAEDGGIACRTIQYEVIDFGGKNYKCAKDHQERVIYIDIHEMEEAHEGSS